MRSLGFLREKNNTSTNNQNKLCLLLLWSTSINLHLCIYIDIVSYSVVREFLQLHIGCS